MSTPVTGLDAVIQKDGSDIGYARGVTVRLDAALIKDYQIGDDDPAILKSGNKTYSVSIERMYIDNSYASDVLNGTAVSIVVRPAGTGTGKPEITISGVVFSRWELTITQDGVVMERVEGEGTDMTFGTQS